MILLNILWPTFALVLLIFVVWTMLAAGRSAHLRRVPPRPEDFTNRAATDAYFEPVELPANNLANLFEMPVLYFALVPLLLFTRSADAVEVALAWLYVGTRAVHSWLHLRRRLRQRLFAYLVGNAILSAMWIGFAVDMIAAALAYTHAVGAGGMQP